MGNCFLHGNAGGESGGLILQFIGSMTAPSNPKENMIWVKTDRAITQFLISKSIGAWSVLAGSVEMTYEASDDYTMTGISTLFFVGKLHGTYGQAWFKPTGLYQSDGAKANPKDAYIYKSGTWVQFSWARVYLYNRGDSCNAITGGYQEISKSTGGTHEESSAMTSNAIHLKVVNYSQHASNIGRSTVNKVNLTNAKTIHISGNCVYTEDWVGVRVCNSQSLDDNGVASAYIRNSGTIALTIDVSNLSGSYYIIAAARSAYKSRATEADIYQIWY